MYLILILIIFFSACQQATEEKSFKPDPVQLVLRPAGADTLADEPGIDAVPIPEGDINGIQIQWYRPYNINKLDKFLIYRSEDPKGKKNYDVIGELQANVSGKVDSIYIDTQDLLINVRYYYYVTAISKSGEESLPSDTVSYRLLEKATNLSLNGNANIISEPVMEFSWWILSGFTPDQYILRIERFISNEYHPLAMIKMFRPVNYDTPQSIRLAGDSLKSIFTKGDYRWRIDCVGLEDVQNQFFEGSESNWQLFKINWN